MRSPCLHYHGPGEPCIYLHIEKNNETCRACKRRLEYVDYIENDPFTIKVIKIKTNEVKPMKEIPKTRMCSGLYCPHGEKSQPIENFDVNATSKVPFTLCRICKTAVQICNNHNVLMPNIRQGQAGKDPAKTGAVQDVVERLNELDVSAADISKLLGITPAAVYSRLEKNKTPKEKDPPEEKDIVTEKFEAANKESDRLSASAIDAITDLEEKFEIIYTPYEKDELTAICKVCGQRVPFLEPCDNKYRLELDFSKHTEVFDDLVALSGERLRDPDKMVLFILIKFFEKGLKLNETLSAD